MSLSSANRELVEQDFNAEGLTYLAGGGYGPMLERLLNAARQEERAAAEDRATRAEALLGEAVKVLEPFAQAARASSVAEGRSGDSYSLVQNGGQITFMDIRSAASFLSSLSHQDEQG